MDASMYQALAARTINKEAPLVDLKYHALHGMVSEVGEIHGLYQKIYQKHPFDNEHEKSEIGDLLWFIAELCTVKGYDLSKIMEMNIEKLKKRYPEGFEASRSLNREKGDI